MTTTAFTTPEVTNKQKNYIKDLVTDRPNWLEHVTDPKISMAVKIIIRYDPKSGKPMMFVARKVATQAISALLKMPKSSHKVVNTAVSTDAVPLTFGQIKSFAQKVLENTPGSYKGMKYAVKNTDPNSPNEWVFYEVAERKSGKYINRLQGAPGNWVRIFIKYADYSGIVERINASSFFNEDTGETLTGPQAAAYTFTKKYKVCSACGSHLSNGKSLEQAMGPICIKKFS